jgi:hypothetical protein
MTQEATLGLSETEDLVMERHGVSRAEAARRVAERTTIPERMPEDMEVAKKELLNALWASARGGSPTAMIQLAVSLGLRAAPGAQDEGGAE